MQGFKNGNLQAPVFGWRWITPASFDMSYRVHPETLCDECATKIDQAGVAGQEAERKRLRQ